MKKFIFYIILLLSAGPAFAQDTLRAIRLPADLTLHFVSPQPIQYVDISSKQVIGDLALPNVLRVRLKDSTTGFSHAIVTIAGESFLAQYELLPGGPAGAVTVNIEPADTRPLDISGVELTGNQLRAMALDIISRKAHGHVEKAKAYDMEARLNQVYTMGNYIFLDVGFRNRSRLKYDIDAFRFKIEDKKVTRAANVQALEITPVFTLDNHPSFTKSYRNVFVFKKLTFPGNKLLNIELSEKQVSGRVIALKIAYKDILSADNLPN